MNPNIDNFITYCDDMMIATEAVSFSQIKAKIVQLFAKLVRWIETKVRKMKNGKVKTALLKLLARAKQGLSKSKSLNEHDKDLAQELSREAQEIRNECAQAVNVEPDVNIVKKGTNVPSEFHDAVINNKITRVRIMIKDSMLVDPSLKQYHAYVKYANNELDDLWDKHDGEELIYDKSKWNKKYMNQLMVECISNFSKERMNLLEKIVTHIYGNKSKSKAIDLGEDFDAEYDNPSH